MSMLFQSDEKTIVEISALVKFILDVLYFLDLKQFKLVGDSEEHYFSS